MIAGTSPCRGGTSGITLFVLLTLAAVAAGAEKGATQPAADHAGKIRIVLAGDSTVTDSAGWGKGFAGCFDDSVEVVNLSKGGRSSKSFIGEGWWKKCLELKPDYVLIQFGHNDQKLEDPSRGTEPQTAFRKFMTRYVDEARAAGFKPLLVTSLSRRQWGPDGKIQSTLVPYVDVVKEIAAEKKVPLLDLHARSIELYEKPGKEGVLKLSPMKDAEPKAGAKPETKESKPAGDAPPPGKVYDGTHLNARGSAVIGPIVAQELKKEVPELAPHVRCD